MKLHNVNQFTSPSNSSVGQLDVLQIPPRSFALMCKMPLELENLYFFLLILDSKDIKDKQLTSNLNSINVSLL